ncbi:YhgE/Pip domain-containing protein [Microbacterium maritypicum]|uniref:ABC transporter n=1 Tax=Microbacterium maritypicum TaxID=33918 RepID=A0A4Y4B9S0_MICMQ|nr:YhgE/Pip family protein [Microbacterium liquefaciens]GEC75910.1 ABC transporter [Microbacterium liquefaciens]GGV57322.1 ABC transporter [Microbacterium liquefaciens]
MTLPIERARSRKPITWLTILGVLLLPAAVGGILVAALQNPTERLDSMTAAIVNLDEPVTIDGQMTPLGRQLAAGLVEGSDDLDSNLTWVISNKDDAADGLADGSYQAVITIPEDFSTAATSAGTAISDGGGKAEQATITVTTPKDGLVADDLITGQLADVAASTMGTMLSEATTENILVGFTTIGDQIGDAADGAVKLANGARDAATGAAAIPDGATKLASGAGELGTGASSLASGLDTIAGKTREAAAGAGAIGAGLTAGATKVGENVGGLKDAMSAVQTGTASAQDAATQSKALAGSLGALAASCDPAVSGPKFCKSVADAFTASQTLAASAGTASGYLTGAAPGVAAIPGTLDTLVSSMTQAGAGATQLSSGLTQLADQGMGASAAGARGLASGATQLSSGATALADGATELTTGLDTLATGTGDLAGGLRTASDSLPSFSDTESKSLASVIADPVSSNSSINTIFGPTAIPLLAAVVLWFGGLATFVVMRAHTARTLTSRRSSATLTLRAFAPAALIGAGQGLLVSLIVQVVASYDAGTWWAFAGTAVLAGVVFAAVNQALVALFGGIGRWISALVGVLAVATGLVSTVPGWLAGIGAALPTAPAFAGLIIASGSAVAALVVWGVLSLVATTLAVTLRRTTSAKAVVATA